jgi:hypothetical protein
MMSRNVSTLTEQARLNLGNVYSADKPDESEDEGDEPVKKKKSKPRDTGDDSEDDEGDESEKKKKSKKRDQDDDRDEDETAAAVAEAVVRTARMVRGDPLRSIEPGPQQHRGRVVATVDDILGAARLRDRSPDDEPKPELSGVAKLVIDSGRKRRGELE